MRKTNLSNGHITTDIPVEVKRKLHEEAERQCMTLSTFVKVMLLNWYRENSDA